MVANWFRYAIENSKRGESSAQPFSFLGVGFFHVPLSLFLLGEKAGEKQ